MRPSLQKRIKSAWKALTFYRDPNEPMSGSDWGNQPGYMADFRASQFGVNVSYENSITPPSSDGPTEYKTETVAKVPVKPKDVLDQLGTRPTNWSLEGLPAKIRMFQDKAEMIEQSYAKHEVETMVVCLQARLKYDRVIRKGTGPGSQNGLTYRQFFTQFDGTDEAHIDALCKKHDLVMKPADIFIPEFPQEAVDVMKEYREVVEELNGKLPRFFVIATKEDFKDADGRRDPILLAQSPFGFYYYILGAWDKEMLLLSEL